MTTTMTASKKQTHASAHCPICNATIVVWKHGTLKASLLRALALADHVKTSHPSAI